MQWQHLWSFTGAQSVGLSSLSLWLLWWPWSSCCETTCAFDAPPHIQCRTIFSTWIGRGEQIRCDCFGAVEMITCKSPHHTTTVLRPFFWDHLGEPVPEENFWTLWCKGRLTGRRIDHLAGLHSIWTNQCPPPPSPYFLQAGCPSCCPTNSVKALKATANQLVSDYGCRSYGKMWYIFLNFHRSIFIDDCVNMLLC